MSFHRTGMDRSVCPILELNDDLLAAIVSRLPVQEIFRLRCVCKMWRSVFTDDRIRKCSIPFLSQTPVFTASLDDGLAAYNIETRSWNRWTSALHRRYFSGYSTVYGNLGDWFLTEDGLVKNHLHGQLRNLCLVNPTKSSSKELPKLPQVRSWRPAVLELDWFAKGFAVGLIPGESSKFYKVFIVNFENSHYHRNHELVSSYKVYLYDSKLDSWKAIWPWELQFPQQSVGSITFCEGALHCVILEEDDDHTAYWNAKVCRYDEQESRWQELSAQISGKFYFQRLFEWQGRVMLIGGLEATQQNEVGLARVSMIQVSRLASIHIWELDKESHVWRESKRMPDRILGHLSPPEFNLTEPVRIVGSALLLGCQFSCEICGRFICLTNSLRVDVNGLEKTKHNYHRHVMCDLSKNSWWEVPKPTFAYESLGFCHLTPKEELDRHKQHK